MTDTPRLQDPRTLYPQPPFPRQPQPAPGKVTAMDPLPDHGEDSYRGSGKLVGRRAMITGGDSGIGRAVAIAFAREGADVALSYLESESTDAEAVAALIRAEGRNAVLLPGDITNEDWCKDMVAKAVAELGGLDTLVINAGHQQFRDSIDELTTADFDRTMKTNLYAMHWIAQAATPHMPPGSAIVTTASVQAYSPSDILLDYATTKAGIVAYTQALSKQMISKGIRANVVAPGPFWTPLQPSGGQPQDKLTQFGGQTSFGRPGQPAEIAPIYVFLASHEGSYITGEVYGATGGSGVA
ncbi:SDR family oxidoreductase [Falsirhodobacter sp. alg1]|uniref:SDR family oxidoreductase n=1 Tax=Falsirhodobacter sp. alg1 TaxID=1472418 RepID=UPI0005EF1BFA|nr:SDR family oxidoreductase [Falsirhodobacter sp. alg1]